MPTPPHLKPKDLQHFEQSLVNFVDSFPRHADAAAALNVHPSAITQALQDVKQGKREVFVRKNKRGFVAISVRYFGNATRTQQGL